MNANLIIEAVLDCQGVPIIQGETKEFRFYPPRRWRADYHIPGLKVLIEIEGGTWSGGRHTSGAGYQKDLEKYRIASIIGFVLLRYTTSEITKTNGQCLLNDLNFLDLQSKID